MTADAASRSPLDLEARPDDPARLGRVGEGTAASAMRRIRVVHCIDGLHVGGTELNLVRTLEHLDRSQLELSVVALNADGPLRARIEAAGVPLHGFPIPNLYGPQALRQLARLAAHIRRAGADVIHCHDMYTNVFGVAAARLAGVPLVIASRRWWTDLPSRAHAVANRLGYAFAHRVLANSDAVGRLVRNEGVPSEKVFVLPNFLEESAFVPPRREWCAAFRGELGIPLDATVVGLVARLSAEKQIGLLVRAFSRLKESRTRAHLVIVGDGTERMALQALASEAGISDRVHFAGHRPNRPNIHSLFDVSVLCSAHEGFPNSVVEAMAAGKPVVATAVGGVPDAVVDGVTGLLVPSGDVDGLAHALGRLMSAPERRMQYGAAGRERARARYHADMVVPSLVELYRSCTRRRRA